MATVVVPFRAGGKSRLPAEIRVEVALAMLGDVLDAASSFGPTRLVSDDEAAGLVARELGVEVVADPGGGQGVAVQAALAGLDGPCLVVNADVPRVRPSDLTALAIPPRRGPSRSSPPRTARRTRSASRTQRCSSRSTAPPAPPSSGRMHKRSGSCTTISTCPTCVTTSIPRVDLARVGRLGGSRTRALSALVAP